MGVCVCLGRVNFVLTYILHRLCTYASYGVVILLSINDPNKVIKFEQRSFLQTKNWNSDRKMVLVNISVHIRGFVLVSSTPYYIR